MSIWGVDQSLPSATIGTTGADVACPSATATNVQLSSNVLLPTGFNTLLTGFFVGAIVLGAVPPTALNISLLVSVAGTVDSINIAPALLVANAVLPISWQGFAVFARGAPVANPQMTFQIAPTGQAVTVKAGARSVFTFSISSDA